MLYEVITRFREVPRHEPALNVTQIPTEPGEGELGLPYANVRLGKGRCVVGHENGA